MKRAVLGTIVNVLALSLAAPAQDAAPPSPAPTPHRGIEYPGAAGFPTLGTITIVYPAAPAGDAATAKASAEARARWLESVFHDRVDVVSDDRVSEAQLRGNLLILGWTNRVWGAKEFPRPFERSPDGALRFAGLEVTDPSIDLLLFHRNPLGESSYVLFWSRIDPERDRFQPLPRIGSDWVLYDDFFPIQQGMFLPGSGWPPARDAAAQGDRRRPGAASPGKLAIKDSEHYRAAFDRTKFGADEIAAILRARESALQKASAGLGAAMPRTRIALNLFDDEPAKREGTGVADPTHSLPWAREIDMVRRFAHSTSPHEEVHLLARDAYGPCTSTAIYEGLAIAVENYWRGHDVELTVAMLAAPGRLPGVASLLDEEKLRAMPEEVGLGAAAGFVAWIRSAYGPAALKRIYALGEPTPAAVAAALGTDEATLSGGWTEWARGRVAARRSDLDFLAAEADAQKAKQAGDWRGTVEALRRAIGARPGDLQTLFNLASAQMRADDLAGAERTLKSLLASKIGPDDARFAVFGHYQLGRVYDLAGRRADALREYDAVLALPDDHGAHQLALDRKSSPATRAQLD